MPLRWLRAAGRWISGSLGLWVSGSLGLWVAGSLGRWVAGIFPGDWQNFDGFKDFCVLFSSCLRAFGAIELRPVDLGFSCLIY